MSACLFTVPPKAFHSLSIEDLKANVYYYTTEIARMEGERNSLKNKYLYDRIGGFKHSLDNCLAELAYKEFPAEAQPGKIPYKLIPLACKPDDTQ